MLGLVVIMRLLTVSSSFVLSIGSVGVSTLLMSSIIVIKIVLLPVVLTFYCCFLSFVPGYVIFKFKLLVREDIVCGSDLFESILVLRLALARVRMVFLGQLVEFSLDIILLSRLGQAQLPVVVHVLVTVGRSSRKCCSSKAH